MQFDSIIYEKNKTECFYIAGIVWVKAMHLIDITQFGATTEVVLTRCLSTLLLHYMFPFNVVIFIVTCISWLRCWKNMPLNGVHVHLRTVPTIH